MPVSIGGGEYLLNAYRFFFLVTFRDVSLMRQNLILLASKPILEQVIFHKTQVRYSQ